MVVTSLKYLAIATLVSLSFDKVTLSQEFDPPENIIYIMLDDADYFDFGYNNSILQHPDAVTPNIDALRANGKAFTQFYSGAAVCTPTRVSVLTGSMPIGYGALDAWPQLARLVQAESGNSGLSASIPQLGHLMQDNGFKTAHHGKWHVGLSRKQFRHEALGFDDFSYHQSTSTTDLSNWSGDYKFVSSEGSSVLNVDYIDDYFSSKVLNFIEENADSNFYINFWPLTPHYPFSPPRGFDYASNGLDPSMDPVNGGGDRGGVIGMMYAIDQKIGSIVQALRDEELLDDTLIIITSDNGGSKRQQNPEYWHRGTKGTFYEGGVRVPMVAHWPNGIAANTTSDTVMTTYDLLPTFLELIGEDPQTVYNQIDGRSKAAIFVDDDIVLPHDPILWEMNGGSLRTSDDRAKKVYAMRKGNYKLVKAEGRNNLTHVRPYFLFDVVNDRQEKNDLQFQEPVIFEQMRSEMLSLRLSESRYVGVPEKNNGEKVAILFDPRLDITSKDMTFVMDLIVPEALDTWKNIYFKPGSQSFSLSRNRQLNWRLTGSNLLSRPIRAALQSEPLAPGKHEVALSIGGFKNDFSRVELYVNGEKVDELDTDTMISPIKTIWSTVSNGQFGDSGIEIENARYYTAKFWPDEWAESSFD